MDWAKHVAAHKLVRQQGVRWRVLQGVAAALVFGLLMLRGLVDVPFVLLAVSAFVASLVIPAARNMPAKLAWRRSVVLVAFLGIVVVGAALRFPGIAFGLPYLDHPDEWATADPALRMLRTADYSPDGFTYPSLTTYLQLGVAVAHFLWGASSGLYTTVADVSSVHFYPWARAFTALLGTLAIPLTFLIGRQLYNRATGLIAAFLLAVYPAASGDAHYITTDTPSMFWTLAAFAAIVWLADSKQETVDGGRRTGVGRTMLAGVVVGLAVSTKYNVAVLVLPLLLAIGLRWCDERRNAGAFHLLVAVPLALGAVALGFTLGTPYWFARLPQLLNDLASIVVHYKFTGHAGSEAAVPALYYWQAAQANGYLLAWAFLAGIVAAFVRRSRADLLMLAFVVPSLLQLASVQVVFFRNTMPVLPLLCLLAASMLVGITINQQRPTNNQRPHVIRHPLLIPLALALVVAAQPLVIAVRDEWLRTQPTTRLLGTAWIEAHVTPGSLLWLENNTLQVSDRFRVRGGEPVTIHPPAWYRENGFSYVVVDRDAWVRKEDNDQLVAFGEPLVSFAADGERHGPMYSIYATGLDIAAEPRTLSGATLGQGALTLDGYNQPGTVVAGETLPLALYWRVSRALPADYVLYVHLVDAQNTKQAQRDTPPLDGARPTSSWLVGELIRDDANLLVLDTVPPGTYSLFVGMYDPQTFAPINDNGPILVGSVQVTP